MVDLPEWERQIDRLADQLIPRFFTEVMQRVTLACLQQIDLTMPVWRNKPGDPPGYERPGGRARASTNVSIGSPDATIREVDPTGATAMRRNVGVIQRYRIGPDLWITNGVPYIRTLEFGLFPNPPKNGTGRTIGGFSTQAPRGMFRQALQTVRQQIPSIVRGAWDDMLRGTFN